MSEEIVTVITSPPPHPATYTQNKTFSVYLPGKWQTVILATVDFYHPSGVRCSYLSELDFFAPPPLFFVFLT